MSFIGNNKIVAILNRFLEKGISNHAFLFSGPQHVGKHMLARQFAASLIARKTTLHEEALPADIVADLLSVSPIIEEKKGIVKQKDISIGQIRDVQSALALFPYKGAYKVLIIDSADRMTVGAQNALLKLLEEPNPTSLIMLVAHDVNKILPTIRSRCQNLAFSLVTDEDMKRISPKSTSAHVQFATGRPGILHEILADEEKFLQRQNAAAQLKTFFSGSLVEKFALAEHMGKDTMAAIDQLSLWTWILHDQALEAVYSRDSFAHLKYAQMQQIAKAIETLRSTNASARLVIENLLLHT